MLFRSAHDGFKDMVRRNAYDAGELAIITYLQAYAYDKDYVLLPTPISGRFQHHTIGYSIEHGALKPKDIEGRKVGVRTYAQTTGLWARGILQHEYGVDLNKVTWLTLDDAHLAEHVDPSNCQRLPKGTKLAENAPSANSERNRLGNWKAMKKASATAPAPRNVAIRVSRSKPVMRLSMV